MYFLIGFRNRLVVLMDWAAACWSSRRSARVVTEIDGGCPLVGTPPAAGAGMHPDTPSQTHPAVPPADKAAPTPGEQGLLGSRPSYDEVLDTAVDYTFPCSDPISVQQSAADAGREKDAATERTAGWSPVDQAA